MPLKHNKDNWKLHKHNKNNGKSEETGENRNRPEKNMTFHSRYSPFALVRRWGSNKQRKPLFLYKRTRDKRQPTKLAGRV